jgi:hypothetical protein
LSEILIQNPFHQIIVNALLVITCVLLAAPQIAKAGAVLEQMAEGDLFDA